MPIDRNQQRNVRTLPSVPGVGSVSFTAREHKALTTKDTKYHEGFILNGLSFVNLRVPGGSWFFKLTHT
jgi:hypothetical protein